MIKSCRESITSYMAPTDLLHLQLVEKTFSEILVGSSYAAKSFDFMVLSVHFGGQKLDLGEIWHSR